MNASYNPFADSQRAPAQCACNCCGTQLYRGDPYWLVSGLLFCENCLEDLARLEFAAHHRICGEEMIP